MSDPVTIEDPDLMFIVKMAQERACSLGAAGDVVNQAIGHAAVRLHGYIEKLHELANEDRLQEAICDGQA
jgi:hypothetical protein